jgi:hypothetical protein
MAEKRELSPQPVETPDGQGEHPVEPAEGAREPGADADVDRSEHPDEPAEGGN